MIFPYLAPVGLGLTALAGLAGASLLIVKYLIIPLGKWISKKIKPQEKIEIHEGNSSNTSTNSLRSPRTSTTATLQGLHGEGAASVIREHFGAQRKMDHVHQLITSMIEQHDALGILSFFHQLSSTSPSITHQELKTFCLTFDHPKPIFDLVHQALLQIQEGKIKLSTEMKNELLHCQPLVDFMRENHVNLHRLRINPDNDTKDSINPSERDDKEQPHPG